MPATTDLARRPVRLTRLGRVSAAWITGGKQSPEDRDRVRKACERGGASIFGSGAHPGMTNLVGMVLTGACERVDEIRITESVDCSTYESAETQRAMGF